jgi:hypothetical protein
MNQVPPQVSGQQNSVTKKQQISHSTKNQTTTNLQRNFDLQENMKHLISVQNPNQNIIHSMHTYQDQTPKSNAQAAIYDPNST